MARGLVALLAAVGGASAFCPALGAARARGAVRASPAGEAAVPDDAVTKEDIREWMEQMDPGDYDNDDEVDLSSIPVRALPPDDADPDENDTLEVVGAFDGTDDALDAPWRAEADGLVRGACGDAGVAVEDVYWEPGVLRVKITKTDGSPPDAEDCADASRAVREALEPSDARLRVLDRHSLEVTSKGVENVLSTQKDFDAFKGFDVAVRTANPLEEGVEFERVLEGRLVERTITDVVINVKGRMVKIPWHLVTEVRLPPAKSE